MYNKQRLGPTLYEAFGFGVPPKVAELFADKPNELWAAIPLETLPDYVGDRVFLVYQSNTDEAKKATEELIQGPVWKNLPAVKEGRAYVVESRWAKQLAEEFGVSKRTIIRNMQDLETMGVPLFVEYGVNGGYQVLRERTPFLRGLLDAALDRTLLETVYESERGVRTRRMLPLGLYAMNGLWYCPALDAKSGRIRVFRADRFVSVRPAAIEPAERETVARLQTQVDSPLDRWLGPQEDEPQLDLEVALTRRGVLRCQSDAWLESGLQVMDDGTGRIVRKMSESYVEWAAAFFISLGSDARVMRPEPVREQIRSIIAELTPVYKEVTE
ncbi:WYL domain-containing protein [Cohnella algarum]|uniref:WYL domain-containing protein n=1 Tax=Cohnella algarum TaxID=2044859 RepID=UPI001967F7CA|nr:WYL domain-containing protein [Cohnella algarum]